MLNLVEILKHCPEGIKLWSPLFGIVTFYKINDSSDLSISVKCLDGEVRTFDKYGRYFSQYKEGKCVLFPSEKCLTWEGWEGWKLSKFKIEDLIISNHSDDAIFKVGDVKKTTYKLIDIYGDSYGYNCQITEIDKNYRLWSIQDAKDGDVLATDSGWTCIFKEFDGCVFSSYCFMDSQKWFCESGSEAHTLDSRINGNIYPATKEQRILFFKKMQEAGYQWYAGKKELRKIKSHYDIANFKAGMPVLVRDKDKEEWCYLLYSHQSDKFGLFKFNAGSVHWTQCIPLNEDTKHLLGTTDMPSDEYINW